MPKRGVDELEREETFLVAGELSGELSARYGALCCSERFSDVTLVVGAAQEHVPAHRLVLGLASAPLAGGPEPRAGERQSKRPSHDGPHGARRGI